MDYRFLAEIIALKPQLFRAMLNFNRKSAAPLPEELASLGGPFAGLWTRPDFRRAWPVPTSSAPGYWSFHEESRRMALLDADTVAALGLFFSAAVHGEELAHVISRDQVLELHSTLGADIFSYALKRGRYQISGLRSVLLVPESYGSLSRRIRILAALAPALIAEGWPEELRVLAQDRLPTADQTEGEKFEPRLRREQRTALWFTMKKLLLREVAPEWAPCFD